MDEDNSVHTYTTSLTVNDDDDDDVVEYMFAVVMHDSDVNMCL